MGAPESERKGQENILGKSLVIVESPAKARTINKFLGKNFSVKASMGHVRDLPKKQLGVDEKNDFKPTYEILASQSTPEEVSHTQTRSGRPRESIVALQLSRQFAGQHVPAETRAVLP